VPNVTREKEEKGGKEEKEGQVGPYKIVNLEKIQKGQPKWFLKRGAFEAYSKILKSGDRGVIQYFTRGVIAPPKNSITRIITAYERETGRLTLPYK